jgi:hypothetical protein
MIIVDLMVAFIFGFVIVGIVTRVFNTKGPWDNFLLFFLVVALFAWSGGIWLVPFGPQYMGIGWAPILFMGFLAVMLLTAASPKEFPMIMPSKKQAKNQSRREAQYRKENRIVIDLFFWLLVVCLVIFGASHYYWYPRVI